MTERATPQGYYLGEQLRRLRKAQNLPLTAAAAHLGCSEAKASRIESGRRKVAVADLALLLDLYQVTDEAQRRYMLDFAAQQETRATGWWRERTGHAAANVPQYLALEAVASSMRNVEPVLIPGLLQTVAYARVAMRARQEGPDLDRETDARVARRARLLSGELEATFLVGEPAIGLIPEDVRDGQLARLLELADLPNVTLRLIPASEVAYLTHGLPLVLLGFDLEVLPDVVYVEHWLASHVVDDPADVEVASMRYAMIEKSCLSPDDTIEWIRAARGA